MEFFENVDLEFKEIYVPEIKKEIIAFANTEGGTLYVGISKDGTVVGVDNPDEVMLQIAGSIKDSVKPDVMPFVKIKAVERDRKTIVEVKVEIGAGRPYYLSDKGLKPSGVYVRRGSSSQPLSDEGIREMIVENSGKSYETCRSMNQELTFHTLTDEMQKRNLEFGFAQMKTLHLVNEDGLYTNLALLLSDQCEHTIKIAFYQGSDKAVFRDRKECTGSLLKQLSDIFELIDFYNKTNATFKGLDRTDKRDYPPEAIREALLNCIVHRDYSFSGSTLINLYEDRMEFVSLGGLVQGISMEAIFMGVSQSRNMNLAAFFYRMRLIESYGTGIGKIQNLYRDEDKQPQFDTAQGVFRVILPNCNEYESVVRENHTYYYNASGVTAEFEMNRNLSNEYKNRILAYALAVPKFKRKDIENLLDLKTTSVFNLLKDLCAENKIRSVGKGKNSHYELIE